MEKGLLHHLRNAALASPRMSAKPPYDEAVALYRPEISEEKQLYWLRKEIIKAYRAASFSNSAGEWFADRNASRILSEAKKRYFGSQSCTPAAGLEPAPGSMHSD